jgi:Tol biopolymer transport system component/DNA-binding winged helix-turn-helix (wHTH) protein
VRINPKSLHVLLVLLDAGEKGVSRDELLDQVWGENYPSDNVISRAMADLRSAFGEKAGEQRYIRTLPKYGYQFVATHAEVDAPGAPPATTGQKPHIQYYRHHYLLGAVVLAAAFLLPKALKTPEIVEQSAFVLSGARPLTSAPGLEHQPRIVPGTEWVVHAVMRRDRNDWDLFRASMNDGAQQPVAVTPGVHEHGPAISPLGDEVAYVRMSAESCDVVIQSIALGVPESIATCTTKFPTLVDWTAAGDQLAFTIAQRIEPDSLRRLYLVDRYSGVTRRLTDAVSPTGTDFYPRFSPSGNKVAFLRGEPQPDHRTTLWVVDVESGAESRLTELPAQQGGMAWLDDSRLIYSLSDAGTMRGEIVEVDSGRSIPVDSNGFMHPDFLADERLLVVAEPRSDQDLALLSVDGEQRIVAQSTNDDHHGRLSPDEQWIAFISRRSGFDELWIASTSSDASRRLTRFDGASVRYPDWHPDGSEILITVQSDAGERLFTVDIVSGAPTPIETPYADITTPRWLADGWIAGCRDASGWGICVGADGDVSRIAESLYRPNPSGGDAVHAVDDAGTLFELSLADGSATEIWDGLPGNGRFGWEVDGDSLYFIAGGEPGNTGRLLRLQLDGGGEPELLFAAPMPIADVTLSIGQQTGTILYTVFQTSSDDLVIYENVDFTLPR